MLMHQMRISKIYVFSVMLKPKNEEIRNIVTVKIPKNPKHSAENWCQIRRRYGYVDMIWIILDCIRATKENNLDLHLSCDQTKYKTICSINLKHTGTQQLFLRNGFSIKHSKLEECG
jgi:hypothetical protein